MQDDTAVNTVCTYNISKTISTPSIFSFPIKSSWKTAGKR